MPLTAVVNIHCRSTFVSKAVMEDIKIQNTDPTCSSNAYNTANDPSTFSELISNSPEKETPDYLLAEPSPDTGIGASVVSALFVSHSKLVLMFAVHIPVSVCSSYVVTVLQP